ncbi:undecaprenyl diphosphate synthase family protein [Candidatus Minimicrobia naudis]|uniref:Undecaprenyl diphosphate synthase family protein n=1 Tax=Candidatus Minimicrobia naudis TaxID=2841263 RepID=A0A8F1SBF6_9BACT|nr:undecaprenyl diphosphate synthase family protein [Candidatus Minimicrobia naudis]
MIVRTSSEQRLSNFIQLAISVQRADVYGEKLAQTLTTEDVAMILEEYANRNRRFGK